MKNKDKIKYGSQSFDVEGIDTGRIDDELTNSILNIKDYKISKLKKEKTILRIIIVVLIIYICYF